MLLTVTTTAVPATDLGWLLHKHPDRLQEFELPYGRAAVFYPEASEQRCTAALHVGVAEAERVADRRGRGMADTAYISDRPYAAGSYLPSAMMRVFGTAIAGHCAARPDLAATAIPLEIWVTPVACRAKVTPEGLFGPLGWAVSAEALPLDPAFPEWGAAPHSRIRLAGTERLSVALRQICVLLPVLDGEKHYFVSEDEVDKLLRLGEGWLDGHPLRHVIIRRYLRNNHRYAAAAEAVLAGIRAPLTELAAREADIAVPGGEDGAGLPAGTGDPGSDGQDAADPIEPAIWPPANGLPPFCDGRMGLQELRIEAAVERLAAAGASRIADLGCGEGDLMMAICRDPRFTAVAGLDPSPHALARAARRLGILQQSWQEKACLLQGAATYPDSRLAGYDAFALLEVIEHIDPCRLPLLEEAVFGAGRPRTVVLTTPNREYNAVWGIPDGRLRHGDHRFEWTREEFRGWVEGICARRGYTFVAFDVGPEEMDCGSPTQGAVFSRG
jgi:SAM-dependent methyltransferase